MKILFFATAFVLQGLLCSAQNLTACVNRARTNNDYTTTVYLGSCSRVTQEKFNNWLKRSGKVCVCLNRNKTEHLWIWGCGKTIVTEFSVVKNEDIPAYDAYLQNIEGRQKEARERQNAAGFVLAAGLTYGLYKAGGAILKSVGDAISHASDAPAPASRCGGSVSGISSSAQKRIDELLKEGYSITEQSQRYTVCYKKDGENNGLFKSQPKWYVISNDNGSDRSITVNDDGKYFVRGGGWESGCNYLSSAGEAIEVAKSKL